jgi:hypothetical protein
MLPSHRAVDDREGSEEAGSESKPSGCFQFAARPDTTNVGIIAKRAGLLKTVQ